MPAASKHLRVLERAGLISRGRDSFTVTTPSAERIRLTRAISYDQLEKVALGLQARV